MELLGTKYQTYIDDELIILRLINIKNENTYVLLDKDGTKVNMNKDELGKCIKLNPDAVLNLMITKSNEGTDDVYVCVNKVVDMVHNINTPALIIRQDTYSASKNAFSLDGKIYMGDCVVCISNSKEDTDKIEGMMEYDSIEYSYSTALYVDDKLEDIIKCIPTSKMNKFNNTLYSIKNTFIKSTNPATVAMIDGYCETLPELLKSNDFMFNYRLIFNIAQVDFDINLGDNVAEDGEATLNKKQIKRIEDILNAYITDVSAVKYDKDIDISKLVEHTHIMLSDLKGDIYLVNYTVQGPYPADPDIAKAMNV